MPLNKKPHLLFLNIKDMTFSVQNLIFEIIFTEKGLRVDVGHLNRHL